jgi:hypothetical protein
VEEMEFVFGMCTFHTALLVKQILARNYEFQRSLIFSAHYLIYSYEIFLFLEPKFFLQAVEFELRKGC